MPDPEFEEFARDYIRLAGQEKSRELRSRLLVLAREWMHAAMQEQERDHLARAANLGSAEIDGRKLRRALVRNGYSRPRGVPRLRQHTGGRGNLGTGHVLRAFPR